MKKYIFVFMLVAGLVLPLGLAHAAYNSVKRGAGYHLFFSAVAPAPGETKGITVDFYKDSYMEDYTADVSSIKIEMEAGSEVHLKSADRKIFQPDVATAETECADSYSTWDYKADKHIIVTLSLSDDNNCPALLISPAPSLQAVKIKDLHQLEARQEVRGFGVGAQISWVAKNMMEILTVESVGSTTVKVKIEPLGKEITAQIGQWNNLDVDGDGYRDSSFMVKKINNDATVDFEFKPIVAVKINGVKPGDLIKTKNKSAVYYYAEDGQRYVFPNQRVFFSWYDSFDGVKTISEEEMAELPIGGLVTYRPGSKLVTFSTTNDVYVVDKGGLLRKLKDEKMAEELYGVDWTKQVEDINEAFYSSYKFGAPLEKASEYNKAELRVLAHSISADKNI